MVISLQHTDLLSVLSVRQLFSDFILWYIGPIRVDDIYNLCTGEGTRRVMEGGMTKQGNVMVERLRVMEGKGGNDEGNEAVEEIR